MNFELWFEYFVRFSHLVAGIAWIGSSFYFIWMDSSFESPEAARRNVEGELYMVHGGFYYQVDKRKIYPGELPKTLHWFKWEATLTWATGFVLLVALYFANGASLLIDPQVHALTQGQAILDALLTLVGSWFAYDLLWHPEWMKRAKPFSAAVSLLGFAALVFWMTRIFSGRGAFILTGAILGSLMVLNVWVRILPGQRKMLREAQEGRVPDYSASAKSKTRSVHNTYFIFPVLFIMLSNHYPAFYAHRLNWLLLILLGTAGALIRHAMVTKKPVERWVLAPAAVLLLVLFRIAMPPAAGALAAGPSDYASVHAIVERRCLQCHSTHPTDDVYTTAPKGVVLETEEQLRAKAPLVNLHVVVAKSMPLGNKTGMTDEERATFKRWLLAEKLVAGPN